MDSVQAGEQPFTNSAVESQVFSMSDMDDLQMHTGEFRNDQCNSYASITKFVTEQHSANNPLCMYYT